MNARTGLMSLLLPDETSRRALEETLADWREERRLATSTPARARTDVRGCSALARVFAGVIARGVAAPDVWRLFAWTLLLATVAATLNPFAWAYTSQVALGVRLQDTLAAGLWLIPGGLVPALLLVISMGAGQPRSQPVRTLASMMLSVVFAVILLGWIVPATNQQFRTQLAGLVRGGAGTSQISVPQPGPAELPFPVLLKEARGAGSAAQSAQRMISGRAALLVAVPTALLLGAAVRRRLADRVPWRITQCAGAAALIASVIAGTNVWPVLSRVMPWSTAVRLERLQIDLWVALVIAWIAVLVLVRTAEPGPRQSNPEP